MGKKKPKINKVKRLHTHSLSYLSADREILPIVSAFSGFYEDRWAMKQIKLSESLINSAFFNHPA